MNNNNNSNNIYFNAITLADWVKQFLFKFAVDISFDRMHPLLSSHIIWNPSLRFLPMIFLVNLFPFPSYFNLHNLMYLGINISMNDMTIPQQTVLNNHVLSLHNNTHPITKNISQHPINQSHPTHYPDHVTLSPPYTQPCLIHNSKFPVSTFHNITTKLV